LACFWIARPAGVTGHFRIAPQAAVIDCCDGAQLPASDFAGVSVRARELAA
jgi:hypothetical protein